MKIVHMVLPFITALLTALSLVSGLKCYLCTGCGDITHGDYLKDCVFPGNISCVTEDFGDDVTRKCSPELVNSTSQTGKLCKFESDAKHCFCNTDACNKDNFTIDEMIASSSIIGLSPFTLAISGMACITVSMYNIL